YAFHSSVFSVAPGAVVACTRPSNVRRSALATTWRQARPEARPMIAATGGRSLSNVPWPRRLWARRRGGSPGAVCGRPFFPRVDVALVGLGDRVGERTRVEPG